MTTRPHDETHTTADADDASKVEGGAAGGAIVGTVLGGPIGTAVGAAVGTAAGGAAETADDSHDDTAAESFDREGQPGDEPSLDLRLPGQGGHVGGSDPEHA